MAVVQGKGRSVDTSQHHVAMPGCFTQFYRKPKVSFHPSRLIHLACALLIPFLATAAMQITTQDALEIRLESKSLRYTLCEGNC